MVENRKRWEMLSAFDSPDQYRAVPLRQSSNRGRFGETKVGGPSAMLSKRATISSLYPLSKEMVWKKRVMIWWVLTREGQNMVAYIHYYSSSTEADLHHRHVTVLPLKIGDYVAGNRAHHMEA